MKRTIAIVSLSIIYAFTWLISAILTLLRWPWLERRGPHKRIIVNGTFHNPNWFHAHITPIVESGYGEVILVCDTPLNDLPNLTYRCPPEWLSRILTRALSKAIWTFVQGIKHPADVYVGYHIFPSAVSVLLCAKLLGGKAVYQVTSGPLELEGGGWHAENALLVALQGPSKIVEKLVLGVVRQFDVAIVRGTSAERYLVDNGFRHQIEIVTGSVRTNSEMASEKDIDIIFVGRLTEYKRPDRLLDVVVEVVKALPHVRVALVGEGPDRPELEERVRREGIEANVEFLGQRSDVLHLLSRARTFTLTSRWEGVSIAMLEAMAMRAVPVVTRVGDLADFAVDHKTGYVVTENETAQHAAYLVDLLSDPYKLSSMADAARQLVIDKCDSDVLAKRWHAIFTSLASR